MLAASLAASPSKPAESPKPAARLSAAFATADVRLQPELPDVRFDLRALAAAAAASAEPAFSAEPAAAFEPAAGHGGDVLQHRRPALCDLEWRGARAISHR
jgi:hypothetical protein